MSDISQATWIWSAKGVGAVAGSAISIAYMLPKGRQEAALRFCVGVVTGVVFGSAAGLKIASLFDVSKLLSAIEISLMGATAASLFSWWGLGMIARLSSQYQLHPMGKPTRHDRSNDK